MSYIDAPLPPHIVAELEAASLPPGVVVKKNRFGRWVAIKEAVYEKLESLGPFATKSAKLNIKFEENSGRYSIDFSKHEKLSVFESLDVIPSGSHGPFSKVTLPESAKAAANIPSEATHFCFCYPPTGVATLSNQQKQNLEEPVSRGDPEFTFLTFGGFAYFDCGVEHTKKFLCANALVQGETGLTFEGPFRWKSEYTQFLYRQSRFEPVTISSLSEKGLQLYCFINPKETLKSLLPNKPWAPCSDGGFVYLYNADGTPHPYDCYFSVTPQVRNSSLSTSGSSFSFPLSSSPLSSSPSSLSSSPSSPCSLSSSFTGLQISPQTQELLQKEKHKEAQQPEKKEKEKEREETEQKEKPFSVVEKVKKPTTGTIEEFLCSICLHRPVRIMLLPCRHLCVCNECVSELKQKSEIIYCPLCRDRVVDSWTVFVTES